MRSARTETNFSRIALSPLSAYGLIGEAPSPVSIPIVRAADERDIYALLLNLLCMSPTDELAKVKAIVKSWPRFHISGTVITLTGFIAKNSCLRRLRQPRNTTTSESSVLASDPPRLGGAPMWTLVRIWKYPFILPRNESLYNNSTEQENADHLLRPQTLQNATPTLIDGQRAESTAWYSSGWND